MLIKKKRNAVTAFQAIALSKSQQLKIKGGNGGDPNPPPPPPIVIDDIADF